MFKIVLSKPDMEFDMPNEYKWESTESVYFPQKQNTQFVHFN